MKASPSRKIRLRSAGISLAMLACLAATAAAPIAGVVPYPHGYRAWSHVKSGLIDDPTHRAFPRFGGLHHVYANAAAREGLRSGRYVDGATFVYDLLETRKLPDGTIDQGPRRHIDVMFRDARRFADTGGWGYEEFAGGNPNRPALAERDRAGCHACHASRAAYGHVFSDWRQ